MSAIRRVRGLRGVPTRRTARAVATAFTGGTVLACAVVSASAPSNAAPLSAAATTALSLTFGTQTGTLSTVKVAGTAASSVRASVVTRNGGTATLVSGFSGSAVQFPAYRPLVFTGTSSTPGTPLAVLRLGDKASTAAADPLNPGTGTFSWGADLSIDNNTGTDSGDGDNLFQRGLSPNLIWKLQLDHHTMTCALKTASMTETLMTAGFAIPATQDESSIATRTVYRALCTRSVSSTGAATLTASLKRRTPQGTWVSAGPQQTAKGSAAGDVSMDPSIPLSVGGKLNVAGTDLNEHPDQFNGIVDNVLLTIG